MARTLLIVDDHADFRSFARALLESEGYDVVGEAADGASAVVAARRLRPAIVLLDIALPDIDGFAVCEQLTDGDQVRPLVVLTSSRDERRTTTGSHAAEPLASSRSTTSPPPHSPS